MWTAEEIFEAYQNFMAASQQYASNPEAGRDRIRWQTAVPFAGTPGHYYFLRHHPRAVSNEQLARISKQSGNPEAVLLRINDVYVVYIGNRRVANAVFLIPPRQPGLSRFVWIAHTHPLEQENWQQGVAHGPTRQDFATLGELKRKWGQTDSTVVVCRHGRVESVVPFQAEPEEAPSGRLWTPSPT